MMSAVDRQAGLEAQILFLAPFTAAFSRLTGGPRVTNALTTMLWKKWSFLEAIVLGVLCAGCGDGLVLPKQREMLDKGRAEESTRAETARARADRHC